MTVPISLRLVVLHEDVPSQVGETVYMKLAASQDRNADGDPTDGEADRKDGRCILTALARRFQNESYVCAPKWGSPMRMQLARIGTLSSFKHASVDETG